jgi:copper resistance protein C
MRLRFIAMALLAAGLPYAVHAHAQLSSATPPAGSTLPAAPSEVTITFSRALEARFSVIEVQDASGTRVDAGDVHVAPDSNNRMAVGLRLLGPGTYKVNWHATSIDTHSTDGSFSFTVKPPE